MAFVGLSQCNGNLTVFFYEIHSLSVGQVFATFATFFYSFLNTQNICSSVFRDVSRNFILQLFRFLLANFYCNFYQVLRKM